MKLLTASETKYLSLYAKKHLLLPTKNKKPLVEGWNKYYAEYRSIEQLLTANQEYSLHTGTKTINDYYFVVIDLDDICARIRIRDSRYIETKQGIHRYLLIKELPKSCWLVDEQGQRIGELHSKGRFVVGIGSIHEAGTRYTLKGRVNEKWSLQFEKLTELQEFLTIRNIFTTPWGKTGKENIRDLKLFQPKIKVKKSITQANFYQQKGQLEAKINQHPQKEKLNICYLCLVYFEKKEQIIKSHLSGKRHQKNWKDYQTKQKQKAK